MSQPPTTARNEPVQHTPHLLYIADPMCSWCYGFGPTVSAIARHFGERLPVRLMMGGLRAGNTRAMRPEDKSYIRDAWTRVHAASGQPFDFRFFEREGFVYDTEPACRAVVAGRRLDPTRALTLLESISQAFYAHNRDTTRSDVLADIAHEVGYDRDAFEAALFSPDVRNGTFGDFLAAQELGVGGFPTLLAGGHREGYGP